MKPKPFVLGLCCGLVMASSSIAFASNSIQALLFPAHFEINENNIFLNNDYKVLNVDGHAYVPIRFVSEHLGATVDYDQEQQKILVKNRALDLSDPDYNGIYVGNLILTKDGSSTKVTGQLKIEGVGNTQNAVEATLAFYNDRSDKIGEVTINGNDFGTDAHTFVTEGLGDFRAYSTVNLHVGHVNGRTVDAAPSFVYENKKNNFTLNLPKSWEGKYAVAEATDEASKFENISFIDVANKEYGGVVFSIGIWTHEDWDQHGQAAMEVGHISKIGEQGDKVFTISTPGDVQYDPRNKQLTAEYTSMLHYVNTIKTSFHVKENLTEKETKDILNQLLPKATEIVAGIFNGPASGFFIIDPTTTIPGEEEYCLVTEKRGQTGADPTSFTSIADLKKIIEASFTKDAADQLFYSRYLEAKDTGLPLYKDYEGRLYVNSQNGGHGWATAFLMDTAKIKSQKDNVVEITLDTTVLDDPYGTLIIKMKYVNGKWLMDSGLDDYKSIINGTTN